MIDFVVRRAVISDAKTLAAISVKTFTETYDAFNTTVDMETYTSNHFNEAAITKDLSSPDKAYFIAEIDNIAAGYAVLLHIADQHGKLQAEISRIYVLKEYKNRKIGKSLLHHCRAEAKASGFRKMQLGVWQQNQSAIAFYEKMGFEITGVHKFLLGNDLQDDWIMTTDL